MRQLEERPEVRLPARITCSVSPTEAGEHILRVVAPTPTSITTETCEGKALLADIDGITIPDLTANPLAITALLVFAAAYALVVAEEFTQLRKSKSVIAAAGIIWVLAASAWQLQG